MDLQGLQYRQDPGIEPDGPEDLAPARFPPQNSTSIRSVTGTGFETTPPFFFSVARVDLLHWRRRRKNLLGVCTPRPCAHAQLIRPLMRSFAKQLRMRVPRPKVTRYDRNALRGDRLSTLTSNSFRRNPTLGIFLGIFLRPFSVFCSPCPQLEAVC